MEKSFQVLYLNKHTDHMNALIFRYQGDVSEKLWLDSILWGPFLSVAGACSKSPEHLYNHCTGSVDQHTHTSLIHLYKSIRKILFKSVKK